MSDRENLPGEVWKPMIGFEDRYEISNMGRVWSIKRPHPAVKTGKIVAGRSDAHGYVKVLIDRKSHAVHRLVLKTFTGPPAEGQQAAHRNGDPSDNRLANLRWATRLENAADKKLHGTQPCGTTHRAATLTAEQVAELRQLRRQGWPWSDLAGRYGVSVMTACAAGIGRTYSELNAAHPPARRGRRYNRSPVK